MKREEIQQHLNSIISNIASIRQRTQEIDFETFRKEEFLKEEIYAELQEIGKTAHELTSIENNLTMDNELIALAKLKDVTYNQSMEYNHQQVWYVINSELDNVGEMIEQSPEYSGNFTFENIRTE